MKKSDRIAYIIGGLLAGAFVWWLFNSNWQPRD